MHCDRRHGEQVLTRNIDHIADVALVVRDLVSDGDIGSVTPITHEASLAVAEILRPCDDFLAGIASFVKTDRANAVEVQHVRRIFLGVRGRNLGESCANFRGGAFFIRQDRIEFQASLAEAALVPKISTKRSATE